MGAVTFISPLYAGSISDKQIIREFGILSLLRPPGMAIMVDRGFLVDDLVPSKIYRPAFLSGRSQMSACEVRDTQAIACLKAFSHSAYEKVRRITRECCFHTERETNVRLLLIHACTLGGADQQCIFPSCIVCISCGLQCPKLNIQQ